MTKLYVKRNMNELAELTFGIQGCTCPIGPMAVVLTELVKLTGRGLKGFETIREIILFSPETYIGDYTKEEMGEALLNCGADSLHWKKITSHLEFIDD